MPASPTVRDQYRRHGENASQIVPSRRASRSIVCWRGDCRATHNMDNIKCTTVLGWTQLQCKEIGEKKCDWPNASMRIHQCLLCISDRRKARKSGVNKRHCVKCTKFGRLNWVRGEGGDYTSGPAGWH